MSPALDIPPVDIYHGEVAWWNIDDYLAVEPTHLKNMRMSKWKTSFPSFGVENKKSLKFHQPDDVDVSKNWGTPKWMVYNRKPY